MGDVIFPPIDNAPKGEQGRKGASGAPGTDGKFINRFLIYIKHFNSKNVVFKIIYYKFYKCYVKENVKLNVESGKAIQH